MTETIGKCIYPRDKELILNDLNVLLFMRNNTLETTKQDLKSIIKHQELKHPSILILEEIIKSTKELRGRVANTPDCITP